MRCPWCLNSELMIAYHDQEWGVPVHDDALLFEYLVLDAFQAGLSWSTILNKRENFRLAFDAFDAQKIALYDEAKIQSLMQDAGIIRNQAKIRATVQNAHHFLKIQQEYGSFAKFIWQFTAGKVLDRRPLAHSDIPTTSKEAEAMSKALHKLGFRFVGPTICYAFMQAAGLVNDHLLGCEARENRG